MIRKTFFWMHLCSAVLAGLVILMMSVTGTVLTYERQIQVWEDRSYFQEPDVQAQTLPLASLLSVANAEEGFTATSVQLASNESAPLMVRMGRSQTQFLNPYSAEIYPLHADSYSKFFSWVRTLHRWFTVTGESRDTARDITGASNLLFLFLLLSGMYLWLPKIISRATLKVRIFFNPLNATSAARDFNWHHVFGFWAAIPLLVIIPTATVFHYSWANDLVYRLAGESPPVRGQSVQIETPGLTSSEVALSIDILFATAQQYGDDWQTLTLALPDADARHAIFTIDEGNGGEPQKRHTLTLNRVTGETVSWAPFASLSSGYKARRWVRFLHTGEALGIGGQTVAGLASIAAAIMVWTGLALALRRFLRWRLRRQRFVSAKDISPSVG
ncbi:MAG: putative iron-regulated membrane protein [Pseudohongiellaceae bacterium]|jgi:uncharacterized iron-regulated membrane protein